MMLLDGGFSVMNPSFGLLFWTSIIFIAAWLFLSRFFKNIKDALKNRESAITESLEAAKNAQAKVADIEAKIEEELRLAREERLRVIKEADTLKEKILEEARSKAEEIARRSMDEAKEEIANRHKEMEINLINETGQMAIQIAQQILQRELEGKHDAFVSQKLEEFKSQR